jgi:hypothetical protein
VISDETTFPLEAYKIEDVRYKVFRFQVSTDQKVGGSSPSKRTPPNRGKDMTIENFGSNRLR